MLRRSYQVVSLTWFCFVFALKSVLHCAIFAQMHWVSVPTGFCRLGAERAVLRPARIDSSRRAGGRAVRARRRKRIGPPQPPSGPPNQGSAGRGGLEWRALRCWLYCGDFGMEEIYAKFVSQKISKTRWRPVPSGSLQTAETFATGSWDNEVAHPRARELPSPFSGPRVPRLGLRAIDGVLRLPSLFGAAFKARLLGGSAGLHFRELNVDISR